jgi:class 3 adenylate cyclase/tetratricopeptide (TPR) repeat protein
LAVVEGEPGIGKTSLLDAVCGQARQRGFSVLCARGGELERDFGFGVVRQLFEAVLVGASGAGRAELLAGVAAIVEPIFGGHGDVGPSPGQDAAFAAQHGLYWLAANLAARAPVLLCVDDAQWADPASLRWLVYLARRLEGVPVAVVVAVRSGETDGSTELLEAVRSEASETVVPRPLTEAASASVVRAALGSSADAIFCRACHETTEGNPFLLSELVSALARGDVEASAAGARRVRQLGPSAVARSVLLRLSRLPTEATTLARAVAVLDTDADVHLAAAVAGIDAARAVAAAESLVRSQILAAGEPLRFAHPILRAAVYEELPLSRRALEHRRAAEVLASRNPDRAAVHLLSTVPAGDPWVAEQLLHAGERAAARGATDAAAALLDRCLAEPPPPPLVARAHLARGRTAQLAADHATTRRALAKAVELSDDPVVRARAAAEVAVSWFLGGDLEEATRALTDAVEALPEDAAQSRAEIALARTMLEVSAPSVPAAVVGSSLKELIATADPSWPSYPLFAALGLFTPYFAADVDFEDVAWLLPAARRLDAAVEVRGTDAHHLQAAIAISALLVGGEIEAVRKACDSWVRRAREQGAMALLITALVLRARIRIVAGRLLEAEADAREAVQLSALFGTPLARRLAMGSQLWALTELGRLDEADRMLDDTGLCGAVSLGTIQDVMFMAQRARLRLGQHRVAQAVGDMDAADRWISGRGISRSIPYWAYASRPEFLLAAGRAEEATAAAREGLANLGKLPPVYRGLVWRSSGIVIGGDEGIDLLRAACAGLAVSPMPVEHARALLGLGGALRRAKYRADAREPLARAMELAHACGAQLLVEATREELVATGARPRRLVRSGIAALTPSELRVAKLAAEGMSNPQIAQQLFVTRRTVETHVAAILRKLDLKGRAGIAAALARDGPASPPPTRPTLRRTPDFQPAAPDAPTAIVTVLFTEIVGSTALAEALGHGRWLALLERHDATLRGLLGSHRGREVKALGDGFLSVFDRPAGAVACAIALRDAMHELGLAVRAGLHTGEVEIAAGDVRGIAVDVAARIAALAQAGEVLVSATVRDVALGTPMRLVPHGRHTLAGVPGEWDVLRAW